MFNKNLRLFIFLPLLILLNNNKVYAQINNTFLNQNITINEADSGRFGINATVFNYLRNTEYFNNIELGRTLFGYQFSPSFSYQPNANIKIQAGAFVQSNFGGETSIIPTFTVKSKYKNLEMLFGTLEGATSHQIIEPMFDIASNIEKRIENGFQIKYQKPKTFFDIWINWEKFIEQGSPFKEQFTAGMNYTQLLNKEESRFKVYSVVQGMMSHAGGQIDADTINKLTMRLNGTLGLKTSYEINKNHKIVLDFYWLGYVDTGDTLVYQQTNNGNAKYLNLSYKYKNLELMCSLFESSSFFAPRGTAIYQSKSVDNSKFTTPTRRLIIPRIIYNKTLLNQIQMSARFEPIVIISVDKPIFDYSFSFYLKYYFEKIFK